MDEKFMLFDNVVLHVLILFTILTALFLVVITKMESKGTNEVFTEMINNIANPDIIKQLITKDSVALRTQLINILKIDSNIPQQNEVLDFLVNNLTNVKLNTVTNIQLLNTLKNNYIKKNIHYDLR